MTLAEWLTFLAIWTVLSLPLGPNAIGCMTAAVTNGTRRAHWNVAGIAAAGLTHMTIAVLGLGTRRAHWNVAGIAAAGLTHMTIAVLGLGTLLLAYAELYLVLKWLGIAYLVWLGVSLWRKPAVAAKIGKRERQSAWSLARRGFTISMSNPKAILSYMAAFPQFITADQPLAPQLLIIVPTAITIVVLVYSGYTAAGGGLARFLTSVARQRLFNRAAGGFYLFIAGLLAFSDTRRA